MSPPEPQPCQKVGSLAAQILMALVLLCVAAHGFSQLCLQFRRLRSRPGVAPARREPRKRSPSRRRARRTRRCTTGAATRRAEKGIQTGGDSDSLRQLRLAVQAGAGPAADTSEHSSARMDIRPVREQKGAFLAGLPRIRAASPGTQLPLARPARILVCTHRSRLDGRPPARVKGAPLGKVVYDARRLRHPTGIVSGRTSTAPTKSSRAGGGKSDRSKAARGRRGKAPAQ